jgi:hypothetical protein
MKGEAMRYSRCFFFVLLLALGLASVPARGEAPSSQRAKIIELMELTGAKSMGDQMGQVFIQQFSAAMQQAKPNIPKRAHEVIRDVTIEILKENSQELLSRAIPVYEKHFTEKEIEELIVFYRTPTGQKAIKEFPVLMQEFIPISQSWASGLQPLLQQRLRERLAAEGLLP